MLAISELDATVRAIVLILAFAAFVLAALSFKLGDGKANLLGVGLALWTFPFAWDALAAA
jgi:hypothetical protein